MKKVVLIITLLFCCIFVGGCSSETLSLNFKTKASASTTLEDTPYTSLTSYQQLTPSQKNFTITRENGRILATFDYNETKYLYRGSRKKLNHIGIEKITNEWNKVSVYENEFYIHMISGRTTFDDDGNRYKNVIVINKKRNTLQQFYNIPLKTTFTTNNGSFKHKYSQLVNNITIEYGGLQLR